MRSFAIAMLFCVVSCGGDNEDVADYEGPPIECTNIEKDAKAVIETYCSRCHSPDNANGGMGYILSVSDLIANGKVVRNDPERSPIYKRARSRSMPPQGVEPRPDSKEIEEIRVWINCGAKEF